MTAETSFRTMVDGSVTRLMEALGSTGAPLAALFDRLEWVAALPNAAAPGFVYLAGACGGSAVGGGGADLAEAAGKLAGEAAETLAALTPPPGRVLVCDPEIAAPWSDGSDATAIPAARLPGGDPVGVPACAVFASPPLDAQRRADAPPRSLGLAAGPDRDAAILAALLELVERDAAAAWWLDGTRPHLPDAGACPAAGAALARLRAGASAPRGTSLLRLATSTGLPVFAALSRDPDGRGLALGLKAALDAETAARGALLEMLQMEIALDMARQRAARDAPTPGDRGALARAALDPDAYAAFAPRPASDGHARCPATLADLVAHLAACGIALAASDLGRPAGGLAVAKVFAPGLRPMPGGRAAARSGTPGVAAPML